MSSGAIYQQLYKILQVLHLCMDTKPGKKKRLFFFFFFTALKCAPQPVGVTSDSSMRNVTKIRKKETRDSLTFISRTWLNSSLNEIHFFPGDDGSGLASVSLGLINVMSPTSEALTSISVTDGFLTERQRALSQTTHLRR